jgi:hypothetical protein
VSKLRFSDGKLAANIFIYVDDTRVTALTKEDCWQATQQAVSMVNSLGIQEAARKRDGGLAGLELWLAQSLNQQTREYL